MRYNQLKETLHFKRSKSFLEPEIQLFKGKGPCLFSSDFLEFRFMLETKQVLTFYDRITASQRCPCPKTQNL